MKALEAMLSATIKAISVFTSKKYLTTHLRKLNDCSMSDGLMVLLEMLQEKYEQLSEVVKEKEANLAEMVRMHPPLYFIFCVE